MLALKDAPGIEWVGTRVAAPHPKGFEKYWSSPGILLNLFSEPPTGSEGFSGGSVVKNPPANAGDTRDAGLIPGLGRSPGEGNGNPLQYSCLNNSMDRGVWWATVHGIPKNQTQLNHHHHHHK